MNDLPLLSVRGLCKSFTLHSVDGRHVEALRGVDLDVHTGQHVALAGTSGAGKSSLLKCVHRTYRPDAGSALFLTASGIRVDLCALSDRDVADLREHEIGYVSQFLRAEPRRGVLDVVVRAAVRHGFTDDEAADAAAEVLRRVRIDERLWHTYPTMLSGGEKQRVNLAAGVVVPPRLLLLDEPVSALDPANRQGVLDVIAGLTATGTGVLSVFHDLEAMERLADVVVLLDAGRVRGSGSPTAILNTLVGAAR